ncbi:MAG: GNAT family N-acetyltransferase [Acidobacteriaceae bacterium]
MHSSLIVGTYQMQPGFVAEANFGYYNQQEFDFSPDRPLRPQTLELSRACSHKDHRSSEVLTLLWRAIPRYCRTCGLRYLIRCSSLTPRDPRQGWGSIISYKTTSPPLNSAQLSFPAINCLTPTTHHQLTSKFPGYSELTSAPAPASVATPPAIGNSEPSTFSPSSTSNSYPPPPEIAFSPTTANPATQPIPGTRMSPPWKLSL